ncbi:hypothetical protein EYF80_053463 [Liparis tanakae]|uniref:Uncharacterized protein n=1 Tax=Liparis tanakae TaxID=230148 RepID=A0A4Z2F5I6_9TELE|nr:hypothetical protein EYF80_053463 [Liparis tanakae]
MSMNNNNTPVVLAALTVNSGSPSTPSCLLPVARAGCWAGGSQYRWLWVSVFTEHTPAPTRASTSCLWMARSRFSPWAARRETEMSETTKGRRAGVRRDSHDAAGLVVVRLAAVVVVQRVEPRVGLVAEGLGPHGAEVEVEAVQEEVNFDPGPPGLRAHGGSRAQDEGGAVHGAASLVLQGKNTADMTMIVPWGQSASGTILLFLLGGSLSGGLRVTLIFGSWTTSRFCPETRMTRPPLQGNVEGKKKGLRMKTEHSLCFRWRSAPPNLTATPCGPVRLLPLVTQLISSSWMRTLNTPRLSFTAHLNPEERTTGSRDSHHAGHAPDQHADLARVAGAQPPAPDGEGGAARLGPPPGGDAAQHRVLGPQQ